MDFKFDAQNWDGLLRLLLLILPGIVFFETFRRFVERPFPGKEVYIAKIVYASMWFYLGNSLLLFAWRQVPDGWRFNVPDPVQVPIQAIMLPALAGMALAFADQRRWFVRASKRLGLAAVDPSPSGWDYVFAQRQSAFVIVKLKDGSEVYGFFGHDLWRPLT